MLQKCGAAYFVMREIECGQCLGRHEEIGRYSLDIIMAQQQRRQLNINLGTLENVGKESIESRLFFLTDSVLSSLRYSSPVNLPM